MIHVQTPGAASAITYPPTLLALLLRPLFTPKSLGGTAAKVDQPSTNSICTEQSLRDRKERGGSDGHL